MRVLSEEEQRALIDALYNNTYTDEMEPDLIAYTYMPREARSEYAVRWFTEAYLRYLRRHRSKERQRQIDRRRRAEKAATADGTWPHWRTLMEEDGPYCAICFEEVVPGAEDWDLRPTVDHIVALFNGGKHIRSNAQLAHHGCNARKANF